MMNKIWPWFTAACLAVVVSLLAVWLRPDSAAAAATKKVLVVMSYHQGYAGEEEIREGFEQGLNGAEIKFFHMDTKNNIESGAEKGREAFKLYKEFKPDVVVAVNDNAQSFFVVPYLKDKVETPVVFCGVNFEATKYGFPATNVTGVLERKHYRESIAFAQVIDPEIKTIAVLYKDNPTNRQNIAQLEGEKSLYPAVITARHKISALAELRDVLAQSEADAYLLLNLTGVVGDQGKAMEGTDVIRFIVDNSSKPTIGASSWEIKAGVLSGVIKSNDEQGAIVAEMVLRIWGGESPQNLPLAQNCNGQRFINLGTLNKIGLKLTPEAVLGTEMLALDQ